MTYAQTWWIWLIGLAVVAAIKWRLHVVEEKAWAKRSEAMMRQFEKMAEHGSPAMGLMPKVMSASSARVDLVDTVLFAMAAGFTGLFIGALCS